MDGVLVIDKPPGITSHDVVAKARRVLGEKRIGHTGTLDPFASGVLVLLAGRATRLARFIDKDEKEYEATIRFGWETDTGDRTGTRSVDRGLPPAELEQAVAAMDWEPVLAKFRGQIMQVPPMYSAKKREGKKLYELARQGKTVERAAVRVAIRELEVLGGDGRRELPCTLRVRVVCSAGTYVRSLAEEIGREAGIGAHLEELRRTRAGRFGLERAVTLTQLESARHPAALLLSLEEAIAHLPEYKLPEDRVAPTSHGLSTRIFDRRFDTTGPVRMIDGSGRTVAIGRYDPDSQALRPAIVLT
jgi:tRNA pseudouridine55 synthase